MKNAAVYGFPGIRVRLLGLAEIYWPFLVFLIASGWLIGCILPVRLAPVPAAVVLFLSALMAWAASKRCEQRFSRFLKGAHGEEMVAHELATLPEGWVVIHGVPRAGILSGGSDFDHVVIAPGALYVIETKNWSGPVTVEGGNVFVRGIAATHSPVAQARREALDLAEMVRDLLPENFPVIGIVCFAGNGLVSDAAHVDSTTLCNLRALCTILRENQHPLLDANHRALIIDRLLSQ